METVGPLSPMALIASFGYLVAGLAACVAAVATFRRARSHGRHAAALIRDTKAWSAVCCSFGIFFFMRVLQVEDRFRSIARGWLMEEHGYSKRWDWQAPAAALLVLVISAALFVIWLRRGQRRERNPRLPMALRLALGAVGTMIVLIMLRLVSLHAIDTILYRGPRLNWVLDTANTVTVILTGAVTVIREIRPKKPYTRAR